MSVGRLRGGQFDLAVLSDIFFWTWTVFGLNLDTLEVYKSDFWLNLHEIPRRNFLDHQKGQIL